jgi:hypothetical protein
LHRLLELTVIHGIDNVHFFVGGFANADHFLVQKLEVLRSVLVGSDLNKSDRQGALFDATLAGDGLGGILEAILQSFGIVGLARRQNQYRTGFCFQILIKSFL